MFRPRLTAVLLAACLAPALPGAVPAEPTDITVRVISRDAKFIGTSMGGARVTIRDAVTGELLAEGSTRGSTGDTKRIMKAPRERGTPIAGEKAAGFSATLDLEAPRRIEVTARAPEAQRQAVNRVSATQWVVPGRHLTGTDGWVLEMPGLVVDVLAPAAAAKLSGAPHIVRIEANVTMMCGCPIEPDGVWDASEFEVGAVILRNGEPAGEIALDYAGETSRFAGTFEAGEPGAYEARVHAYQQRTGNTGLDHATFVVEAED